MKIALSQPSNIYLAQFLLNNQTSDLKLPYYENATFQWYQGIILT